MTKRIETLKKEIIQQVDFSKGGIIPAIIKDHRSGDVLMLAYMNEKALTKTLETGYTWFYSRSKDRLWNKGESSGNKQQVVSLSLDCDKDAILVEVIPHGPSCHKGEESCFHHHYQLKEKEAAETEGEVREKSSEDMFFYLENIIKKRLLEKPAGSYVVKLNEKGENSILKKLGEETSELIMAIKDDKKDEIVHEASDLIFHLILSLKRSEVSLDEVIKELEKRHQEKGR